MFGFFKVLGLKNPEIQGFSRFSRCPFQIQGFSRFSRPDGSPVINTCLEYYGLDPCHYVSSPGLSWDAMLKMTGIELKLISDIDMHLFVEKGKTGVRQEVFLRLLKVMIKQIINT